MKNVILEAKRRESILLAVALVFACMFVACSGNGNSSAPDSIADLSSSSSDDEFSQKDNSSSSVDKKSSSSEQGNSSVGDKSSSSSAVESSSSELVFHRCDDGDTSSSKGGGYMYYFICKDNEWEVDHVVNLDSLDSLAAIEKNKEHPNMDSLFAGYKGEYFEFEDPRDNRKYKYVEFIWHSEDGKSRDTFYVMAENLNYGKMVLGGATKFDDKVTEKLCYVDDEWFCDNHFGGLYSWAEAMNLPKVCDSVAVDSNEACKSFADAVKKVSDPRVVRWQGICPEGWHIMTQYEWQHTTDNSSYLRSKILWEEHAGLNGSGMSIIPTGNGHVGIHEYTYMWLPAAEDISAKSVSILGVASEQHTVTWSKVAFQSIRCVMDANNTLIY